MSNPYASPEQQNESQAHQPRDVLQQSVRQLQVITGALVTGATTTFGLMLFLNGKLDGKPDITTWIGIGMAVFMFVNHLVIPGFLINVQLSALNSEILTDSTDDEKVTAVLGPLRTGHIVGCAMLEGAAVMNAVLYMVNDCLINLIAAAVFIVLLLLKMPTTFGMQSKVADRLREIEMR